tara:strand:+ start:1725 stop:3791 length:2067 start_codon:yes stop_codon:yes gene_type:complete
MPLLKYKFKPGVNTEGTNYSNENGWFNSDKIRFRKGRPEKIGGWEKISSNTFTGTCRAIHLYKDIQQNKYTILGTHQKLYVKDGVNYNDITPIRATTSAGDVTFAGKANTLSSNISATDTTIPLTSSTGFPSNGTIQIGSETINYGAVSGNDLVGATRGAESTTAATHSSSDAVLCATLTVSDTAHGAVKNDFVTFSSATSLGGNITAAVLNQEYQIVTIINANSYTVKAKDTSDNTVFANSSDSSNGGSSTVGAYQINVGLDDYVNSTGFGVGLWGDGTWGSSTAVSLTNQLRLWSIDNFGDDTISLPRGGALYYWDESSGVSTRAVAASTLAGASDVPVKALQIMMSDVDRHVIAFGCNAIGSTDINPMLVRFSDAESAVDWTPTATNSAGGVQLSTGSQIIGAYRTRQEIIIFTDAGLVSMRFVGSPFIFSFNEVASGISMIAPNAVTTGGNSVYFMDNGGFYQYSGAAQRLPCTVLDHVFNDINLDQAFKIFAADIPTHNEIVWFYPSASSDEIDRYVTFNYLENTWSIGTTNDGFTRTAWNAAHINNYPLAAGKLDTSNSNYLYNHEFGYSADGSEFTAFIESSDFDLDPAGENFMFVSKIVPDLEYRGSSDTGNTVTFTIKGRDYPLQDLSTLSTISVTPSSTFTNTRARSRQSAIRVESTGANFGWRLGDIRLELRQDGKR